MAIPERNSEQSTERSVAAGPAASVLTEDGSSSRKVLGLAWPVFVENLLQTMVGAVDTLMVSVLGTAALAGVGTSVVLIWVIQSSIMAVAMGGNVLVAHAVGARDQALIGRSAKQTVVLGLLLSLVLTIVGSLFAEQLVVLLGPEEEVLKIGADYMLVTMATSVGLVMMFVTGGILRGAGDTRSPMYAGVVMNVINVPLSFVLIFGSLGFPELGPVGSAWGAAAARFVGTAGLLYVLFRGNRGVSIGGRGHWRLETDIVRRLLRIGIPAMLEQLLMSLSMLVYTAMVISLGTAVYAAQRITFQVLSLGWMPGFAFAVAATTLTGQALGAGRARDAVRATWIASAYATLFMMFFAVLAFIFSEPIAGIYTDDAEITMLAGQAMRILAIAFPLFALSFVLQGGLRGAGDTRFPMLLTGVSSWLVRLPLAWYFGVQLGYGLAGMYWTFMIETLLRLVVIIWRYQAGKWQNIAV